MNLSTKQRVTDVETQLWFPGDKGRWDKSGDCDDLHTVVV